MCVGQLISCSLGCFSKELHLWLTMACRHGMLEDNAQTPTHHDMLGCNLPRSSSSCHSLPLDLSLSWKLALHGKATLAWNICSFSLPLDLSLSWKLAMHGKATLAWKMFLFLAAWPLWLGRCLQDGAFLCNLATLAMQMPWLGPLGMQRSLEPKHEWRQWALENVA